MNQLSDEKFFQIMKKIETEAKNLPVTKAWVRGLSLSYRSFTNNGIEFTINDLVLEIAMGFLLLENEYFENKSETKERVRGKLNDLSMDFNGPDFSK